MKGGAIFFEIFKSSEKIIFEIIFLAGGFFIEGYWEIEKLMREYEELMIHSEEFMRKLRNTDNSGHYVRPHTHNVRAHELPSHQFN